MLKTQVINQHHKRTNNRQKKCIQRCSFSDEVSSFTKHGESQYSLSQVRFGRAFLYMLTKTESNNANVKPNQAPLTDDLTGVGA